MDQKYTCICCRVMFADADIQRSHYKTDWHRYNLKRKVATLPPVTAEEFQKRVLELREINAESMKDTSVFCKACRKSFSAGKSFENHLNSKKHKEQLTAFESSIESEVPLTISDIAGTVINTKQEKPSQDEEKVEDCDMEDSDIEEVDSDEWDDLEEVSEDNPILANNCLFCPHHSKSLTKNIKHMFIEHGFFIPDVEYVVDTQGLLLYLGEKVCKFYMCLWCNNKGFQSMEAAQAHMKDKGHTKMLHEGSAVVEYEQFYNYATSYPDFDESMDVDGEVDVPELPDSEFTLTLPSGAKIGHRSLMIYYKQHFNPNNVVSVKKHKNQKVMGIYKALGWTGSDKHAVERNAKDIQFLNRQKNKYFMRLGMKANKLQKHFRPQVNF